MVYVRKIFVTPSVFEFINMVDLYLNLFKFNLLSRKKLNQFIRTDKRKIKKLKLRL